VKRPDQKQRDILRRSARLKATLRAKPRKLEELTIPSVSASEAGLLYVSDESPGYRREPARKGFRYRETKGKIIRHAAVVQHIKSLAIPPAWTEVWICPDPTGHLQATGRDDRGRKQHRYHPHWRQIRDETKYGRMIIFGRKLPQIRRRIAADLGLQGLPRNKVLATVVRLLEISAIRVGNDEYARDNESFGLTTMKDRHVEVSGSKLRFHFRGKGGKMHEIAFEDRHLAKIVRRCQDLPGQELFQYIGENGGIQDVRSSDVNDYLREISGEDFTAKDYRTWSGTVLAAAELGKFEPFTSQKQAKKNLLDAIAAVAKHLGNTPAICRKCYVHPDVAAAYLKGTLADALRQLQQKPTPRRLRGLRREEAVVLQFLRRATV